MTILGHLDRRTRTVQFQIKDSHVDKVMLDILQKTACPYTSQKYEKYWINAYHVDSDFCVFPACGG